MNYIIFANTSLGVSSFVLNYNRMVMIYTMLSMFIIMPMTTTTNTIITMTRKGLFDNTYMLLRLWD